MLFDTDYIQVHVCRHWMQWSMSDGGIFKNNFLFKSLGDDTFHIAEPQPLPRGAVTTSFLIVVGDIFGCQYLMKAFSPNGLIQNGVFLTIN